jgi:hypothetical protein
MQIIIPGKDKKIIRPAVIFKQAWGICWRNLGRLGVIYLLFNLPIAIFYFTPMADNLQSQQLAWPKFIWVFLPILFISIWGHIALLLAAKKATHLEVYTIGRSIIRARGFFLKYLGTILLSALIFIGVSMLGSISIAIALALLLRVNKILAALICLFLTVLAVGFLVYFILRWSLATIVCVLENVQPIAALKRSLVLVADYVYPVIGVFCSILLMYFVCLLPIIIAGAFLDMADNPVQANRIGMIYSVLINIILVPFWAVVTILLYEKLKEATEANVHA